MDGGIVSFRLSPTRMPSTPLSHPEMTSPTPASANSILCRLQRLLTTVAMTAAKDRLGLQAGAWHDGHTQSEGERLVALRLVENLAV